MAWRVIASAAFVLAVLPPGGCGPQTATPTRLVAHQRPYVSDVPVPAGFQIQHQDSEDLITGRRRIYVRHVYAGRADGYAVRNFYIDHMPRHGWRMLDAGYVDGEHTLHYRKGQEACVIKVSRDRSGWGEAIRLSVLILPVEPEPEILNSKKQP